MEWLYVLEAELSTRFHVGVAREKELRRKLRKAQKKYPDAAFVLLEPSSSGRFHELKSDYGESWGFFSKEIVSSLFVWWMERFSSEYLYLPKSIEVQRPLKIRLMQDGISDWDKNTFAENPQLKNFLRPVSHLELWPVRETGWVFVEKISSVVRTRRVLAPEEVESFAQEADIVFESLEIAPEEWIEEFQKQAKT